MNLLQVKFQNDILEVVENGQRWVSVNKICENLGIATNRQIKKLKSDPTYEARLIEVPTAGGVQKVFCIPLEKLNGWLFTINPNKVKPEVKQKLIAYKNECFKVLYNHFLAKAQNAVAHCPASDNLNTRIAGYKGQLALRKKEIEELRWQLAACKNELKEMEKRNAKDIQAMELFTALSEHNLLDLAGQMARYHKALSEDARYLERQAEIMKSMAKTLQQRAQHAQFFLDQFLKYYPKAKEIVDTVKK